MNRCIADLSVLAMVFVILTACSGEIDDEKIAAIRVGMDVGDVIALLGKPHEAYQGPHAGGLLFVYRGRRAYHNIWFMSVMVGPTIVVKKWESREGGGVAGSQRVNVVIRGNTLEFQ
jgi:hypothetical protein